MTLREEKSSIGCDLNIFLFTCYKKSNAQEKQKTFGPGKIPGIDELPAEFYKTFRDDIAPSLIASLNFAYKAGTLSVSQRQGVIKLIPKKDANLHLIKNWRPLTLLNCDYKIATKAITNRIKSVIPQLINNDQTDFLKDKFIGENIRLINNVINYTAQHEIPSLLLFSDFKKAFDSLEWSFVNHMFQYFGFGPPLTNCVQTIYPNFESCTLNNGWSSDFFTLQRRVQQGCPLSPYLFILSVEVLGKSTRANSRINGVAVNKTEIKISQYTNDTTLILNNEQESLAAALDTIDNFSYASGLKLNDKKTEDLWIWSNGGKNKKLLPEKNFRWTENKVKVLSIWISTDPTVTLHLNYTKKREQIRNILSCWKYRWLTLIGKIQVLKVLAYRVCC